MDTAMVPLYWTACYLLGAVPFGFLAGRLWGNVDIRTMGSGNIGATNVLRTLGAVPAVLVLLLDAAKGWAAVWVALRLGLSEAAVAGAALAAVAGHNWPVFLGFRGGRGIATALGVLIALAPMVAAVLVGVWLIIVVSTRYVSLGSMVASALLPLLLVVGRFPGAYAVAGLILAVTAIWRHRPNIARLLVGTEHRIGDPIDRGRPYGPSRGA
ncbi:MAG TPA: glycerol-3-phosphate 1-O-acyltransferase PlsY [Limnochordales bacterium]